MFTIEVGLLQLELELLEIGWQIWTSKRDLKHSDAEAEKQKASVVEKFKLGGGEGGQSG